MHRCRFTEYEYDEVSGFPCRESLLQLGPSAPYSRPWNLQENRFRISRCTLRVICVTAHVRDETRSITSDMRLILLVEGYLEILPLWRGVYTCIYIYVYTCVCLRVYVCVCTYIYIRIHIYIQHVCIPSICAETAMHTCMHTYRHTYTHIFIMCIQT